MQSTGSQQLGWMAMYAFPLILNHARSKSNGLFFKGIWQHNGEFADGHNVVQFR
jgi:hypothetical protein